MTLETKLGARPNGWAPLRSALSVAVAATFAVTMIAPTQLAYAGERGGSVDAEPTRLEALANRARHIAIMTVAAVEHAAQVVVVADEAINLVDQQCRTMCSDHAEQRCRGNIAGK